MKKLPVDLDELAFAFAQDDPGYDDEYWFDTRTGDMVFVSSDLDEDQEVRDQIGEDSSVRFVRISSIDSRDQFRIVRDFVKTLPAGRERDNLESSLPGPGPFSRFEASLDDVEVLERWSAFRNEAVRRSVIAWLAALGIQSEGVEESESEALEAEGAGAENDEGTFNETSEEMPRREETGEEGMDFQDQLESPISDQEEIELATFVGGLSEGQYDFPKFHGLLTAIAVGPTLFSPSEIVPMLSQKSKTGRSSLEDFTPSEKILGLIARLQTEIVLDLDGQIFEPESFEREHPSGEFYPDTFSWCEGFVLGINHNGKSWEKWYKDWRREKAISAIEAAASREFRSSGVFFETPEKMWALYDMIENVVPLIRSFWRLESELDEIVGTSPPPDQPKS